jgi:hypothetical protein
MSTTLNTLPPCLLVRLPDSMKDFFREQGYISSNIFENRTSARLGVRCASALEVTNSPPFIRRTESLYQVLIKDLSKKGLGLIAHQQLYPLEEFWVELLGKRVQATVVRCRKIDAFCYEVGSRIISVNAVI